MVGNRIAQQGMVNGERYVMHYNGDKWSREFGVGVVLNGWASACLDAIGHIDRTMMWIRLKMCGNRGVTIIICHAPTQDKKEEEIDDFYGKKRCTFGRISVMSMYI